MSCVLQAEEDATDLLDYALDMVGDGEALGKVLEELAFIEMEICDEYVLENVRISIGDFVMGLLAPKKKNWRDEMAAMAMAGGGQQQEQEQQQQQQQQQPESYEVHLLSSDNHVSVDLSCKNAADKKRVEMESLFGNGNSRRASSLKDRMSMYVENGVIVKHGAQQGVVYPRRRWSSLLPKEETCLGH